MKRVSRIIDVNCNRTREGLRVLEEIARFWLDNTPVFRSIKQIRHEFAQLENTIRNLCPDSSEVRDSENDVGKPFLAELESNRPDIISLAEANARRVEESLRVLEEFLKLTVNAPVTEIKKMRFDVYTIEKEVKNGLLGQ